MKWLRSVFLLTLCLVPIVAPAQQPIVIDHNSTDISKIPAEWIERAKALVLHYAHTSHGSQIVSGLDALKKDDPRLNYTVYSGQPRSLPATPVTLRIFDGQPEETYITPELYWSEAAGIAMTRAVAGAGLFGFSMWAWCGQQSSNTTAEVQQYLDTMSQFEASYPGMRFILMTGHTDGGSATLTRNNNMVRDYTRQRGKALFDFADIESYDPAGVNYPDTDDSCGWCTSWCSSHPSDCQNLTDDCAHSHPFNCKLKARAFWWMMARLAGWDGSAAPASGPRINANGVVNAASFVGGTVAPGEIVTVFGDGFGPDELAPLRLNAAGRVDTTTGETRVLFDGVAAPMVYSWRGQACAAVPYSVAGKSSVGVQVEYRGTRTPAVTATVAAAAPGIFAANSSGSGQGAVLNADMTLNGAANPARPGTIVVLYLTGEGETAPAGVDGKLTAEPLPKPRLPVTARIDGADAEVAYAGAAPTLVAGVMQVNVRVPPGTRLGNAVPVVVKVGEFATPAGITIAVQ